MITNALEMGKRCAFIVDRVELVEQASERFAEDGIDHGVIQGDHHLTDHRKLCQVATIQTLRNRRMQDFDFCFIDECHTMHETHKKYMKTFNAIPFIGLSATPFTKGLGQHFQDMVVPITMAELMQQGYLCEYDCFAPSEPDLEGIKVTKGDYDPKQLGARTNTVKLVGDIVRTHTQRARGRPTIVFASSIDHSKHIVEEFRKTGLRAVHVDHHTPKAVRKAVNDAAQIGDIDILSCVGIYEKGWDAPIFSCLIDANPTKSLMRYVQRWGRILRTHHSKTRGIVLDHSGNSAKHGWIENIVPISLCTGDKKESEIVKKEKEKPDPKKCPKCGFLGTTFICKMCGHNPGKINVEVNNFGELEKKDKKPKATLREREDWYSMLLGYSIDKGYSKGWAYYKCREKFGQALLKTGHINPQKPSEEVKKYIQYLNIKNAKRKQNASA